MLRFRIIIHEVVAVCDHEKLPLHLSRVNLFFIFL